MDEKNEAIGIVDQPNGENVPLVGAQAPKKDNQTRLYELADSLRKRGEGAIANELDTIADTL